MSTWFTASLFFEGIHHGVPVEHLWEEVVVLVEASDTDVAHSLAVEIARQRQHSYYVDSPMKHLLEWKFVRVERVVEVDADSLVSGTELFARFLRASEAKSILQPMPDEPLTL